MGGINLLRNRDPQRKRIMMVIARIATAAAACSVRDVLEAAEFNNVIIYPWTYRNSWPALTSTPQPTRRRHDSSRRAVSSQRPGDDADSRQQLNNNGDWTPDAEGDLPGGEGHFQPGHLSFEVYSRTLPARASSRSLRKRAWKRPSRTSGRSCITSTS